MATPPDPNTGNNVNALLTDSFLASILGGMAMTARILLSHEPISFFWIVRRVLAASIAAILCGLAVKDQISSDSLRYFTIGAVAYCSPECFDFLLRYIKARGEKEIQSATKLNPNAKSKTKARKSVRG
jgi:hypothetical protein